MIEQLGACVGGVVKDRNGSERELRSRYSELRAATDMAVMMPGSCDYETVCHDDGLLDTFSPGEAPSATTARDSWVGDPQHVVKMPKKLI